MNILIPIDGFLGKLDGEKVVTDHLVGYLGQGHVRFQVGVESIDTMPMSPLVSAALRAFMSHVPLRIEPAHFWITILQEVATMVKQNPRKYAHVFHGDPDNKQLVKVICDELSAGDQFWPLAIGRFYEKLGEKTGMELMNGFFPHFSTDDQTRELVYLVSAMDAASPFFKYEVHTRCGIPEIHLEGTLQDWANLYRRVEWLEVTFGQNNYFARLKSLIYPIGVQVKSGKPDVELWKSYFKYKTESGGDAITGWITDLYAHTYKSQGPILKNGTLRHQSNEFPSGLSIVPFVWVLYGQPYPMRFFSGLTGVSIVDGALSANIGYGVIEGDK